MKNNIISLKINAYTLREVAGAWGRSEREILQLGIDGRIRLAAHIHRAGNVIEVGADGEGYELTHPSIVGSHDEAPLTFGGSCYCYLPMDDLAAIDRDGGTKITVFDDSEYGVICYKEPKK